MWIKKIIEQYHGVKKENIWKIWKDINNYTLWHTDLEYCKLAGEFQVGNFFRLKPKGAPEVKVYLIETHENKHFLDVTNFSGAKMYVNHETEETKNGVLISNTVTVKGLLSFLWVYLVAKNVAISASKEMDRVVELARKKRS